MTSLKTPAQDNADDDALAGARSLAMSMATEGVEQRKETAEDVALAVFYTYLSTELYEDADVKVSFLRTTSNFGLI